MTGTHRRESTDDLVVAEARRLYRRAKVVRWVLVLATAALVMVWAPWWGGALVVCLVGVTLVAAVVGDRREWEYRVRRHDASRARGGQVARDVAPPGGEWLAPPCRLGFCENGCSAAAMCVGWR